MRTSATGLAEPRESRSPAANVAPVLGVCLGMQVLFDSREKEEQRNGLGILRTAPRGLPASVRVPTLDWNFRGLA